MVLRTLLKFVALGFGALFALVVVLSVLLAVLGTLIGLGVAVFSLVFVALFFAGTLAAGVALIYGAYVLLSDDDAEPTSVPVDNPESEDPIERLKRQYATGDIDEAEFERRLERELDGDTIDRELARERER